MLSITIFLLISLVGCSNRNSQELSNTEQNESIEENVVEEAIKDGDPNYPNVEGYPIEKDDIKLCRVLLMDMNTVVMNI